MSFMDERTALAVKRHAGIKLRAIGIPDAESFEPHTLSWPTPTRPTMQKHCCNVGLQANGYSNPDGCQGSRSPGPGLSPRITTRQCAPR